MSKYGQLSANEDDKAMKIARVKQMLDNSSEQDANNVLLHFLNAPPTADVKNMRQDEEANEMLDQVEAEARNLINGGKSPSAKAKEPTFTEGGDDDNPDDPIDPSQGGMPVSDLSSIAADEFPEFYEAFLQTGTEISYELIYDPKVKKLLDARDQVRAAITTRSLETDVKEQYTAIIAQMDERLKYYDKRMAEIETKIIISDNRKRKIADMMGRMIQVSEAKVSPFWVLAGLLLLPLIQSVLFVWKDRKRYVVA